VLAGALEEGEDLGEVGEGRQSEVEICTAGSRSGHSLAVCWGCMMMVPYCWMPLGLLHLGRKVGDHWGEAADRHQRMEHVAVAVVGTAAAAAVGIVQAVVRADKESAAALPVAQEHKDSVGDAVADPAVVVVVDTRIVVPVVVGALLPRSDELDHSPKQVGPVAAVVAAGAVADILAVAVGPTHNADVLVYHSEGHTGSIAAALVVVVALAVVAAVRHRRARRT